MITPLQWKRHVQNTQNGFFKKYSDIFKVFAYNRMFEKSFKKLVTGKIIEVSKDVFGTRRPPGIAVFFFGALARKEMLERSDLDIIIFREGNGPKDLLFREKLIATLKPFDFTKIDTPEWGTLENIESYIQISVNEGSQALEAQFIYGDLATRDKVEKLRMSLHDSEIAIRNIIFEFFYFNQYFGKKIHPDHLNIKYCHGGTRDFLFPMWYFQLKKGIKSDFTLGTFESGLGVLVEEGLLSKKEMRDIVKYASALKFIRAKTMDLASERIDKDGEFSSEKAQEICKKYPYISQVEQLLELGRKRVTKAKAMVWVGLTKYFEVTKSEKWNRYFKKVLRHGNVTLPPELQKDEILNTVKIWHLGDRTSDKIQAYIKEMSLSNSWVILASLLSSPLVSTDMLDDIIRTKGFVPGYEYFQEIVSRNKNVSIKTIKRIVKNDISESRYKQFAIDLFYKMTRGQK